MTELSKVTLQPIADGSQPDFARQGVIAAKAEQTNPAPE